MIENESAKSAQVDDSDSGPSVDETTGQPIEEAEDNLSRHSNRDSTPTVNEQGRTTEKVDEQSPRTGSELRERQDDGGAG
jgi:hypothetical protein